MATEGTKTGVIKKYDKIKGFGFIVPDESLAGKDVFFHVTQLMDGIRPQDLNEGQNVEFELYTNAKGFNAQRICPIG